MYRYIYAIMTMVGCGVGAEQMRYYNFYGLETPLRDLTCSWKHPVDYYIDQLASFGFNGVRLPWSAQYIREGNLDKMDDFIKKATGKGMEILLDLHRIDSNYQSANPFDTLSMTQFTDLWVSVLDRYRDNPRVTGVGLFNEFQGSMEQGAYWSEMMGQAITRIDMTQPPNRWTYYVGGTQWSGNLRTIDLETHPLKDQIFYETHKYEFSGDPTNHAADWDASFGRYPEKVFVGEWSLWPY